MSAGTFRRDAALEDLLKKEFDVLVVGGGITGAGVALDAAARGLRTAMVEMDDFASGTSSKSSKLIHGGLRYLQQGDVRLVYEALHERQRLIRNAPHLVKVLPFLIPLFKKGGVVPKQLSRALGAAMWMYDITGGVRIGRVHKRLGVEEALGHMPTLPRERLGGAYLYFDAEADDARLTLTVARTAALTYGATVVNGVRVTGLDKTDSGQVRAIQVSICNSTGGSDATGPTITGAEIRARCVVNASGVWADQVRAMDEGSDPHSIRPAKGVHITIPWRLVRNDIAAVVPVPGDKRSVFVVPWGDLTFVGTTDTDYSGPIDDPQCSEADIAYLLRAINSAVDNEISEQDIVGTWAGLRPLVQDASSGRTADLSRRHKVATSRSNVITVTGGKLTTYRRMAADTVDAVVESLGDDVPPAARRGSQTKRLRLLGAAGYKEILGTASGARSDLVLHLANRYGGEAREVIALIEGDESLAEPLVAHLPYVRAEAVHAVRSEMARSVDDVLSRRTRARLLARDDSARSASSLASLLGAEMGWDSAEQARQVHEFEELVDREREAAVLPETAIDAALRA